MNDWNSGTTYAPQGAFLQRNLQGDATGVTPGGQQGAFRTVGGALQGGANAYANPKKNQNPMGAAAQGFAGAYSQPGTGGQSAPDASAAYDKNAAPLRVAPEGFTQPAINGSAPPSMADMQTFLANQGGGQDWRKLLGIGGA